MVAVLERLTLDALLLSSTLMGRSFYDLQRSVSVRRFRAAGITEHTASLPHGDIHYWAGGKGRPLLLVHGFGGDAMFGWFPQTALARDHFLIAPDLLWFGGSHSPEQDFSTFHQAEAIIQLLDHLALDEVDVCGISYGGFVTLELAHHWPERFGRLVIVDSPGHTYSLADYHEMLDRKGLDSVADLVVPEGPEGVQTLLALAFHRPPPMPSLIARDIFEHMFVQHTDQKVRLLDDLLARADTLDADAYIFDHETLVLWGEHDDLFPRALGQRLTTALGDHARFEVLPRTNHAPNLERPLLFNKRIRAFLAEPRAPRKKSGSTALRGDAERGT